MTLAILVTVMCWHRQDRLEVLVGVARDGIASVVIGKHGLRLGQGADYVIVIWQCCQTIYILINILIMMVMLLFECDTIIGRIFEPLARLEYLRIKGWPQDGTHRWPLVCQLHASEWVLLAQGKWIDDGGMLSTLADSVVLNRDTMHISCKFTRVELHVHIREAYCFIQACLGYAT